MLRVLARTLGLAALAVLPGTVSCSSGPAPGRVCTIAQPTPSSWRLAGDGTLFRDALGRVVFLRGVNAGGRSKFAPYMPFDYTNASDFPAKLASFMYCSWFRSTSARRYT